MWGTRVTNLLLPPAQEQLISQLSVPKYQDPNPYPQYQHTDGTNDIQHAAVKQPREQISQKYLELQTHQQLKKKRQFDGTTCAASRVKKQQA